MSLMFVVLLISSSEFDFHKIKQKVNTAIFESIDLLHENKGFHPNYKFSNKKSINQEIPYTT